eukprot:6839171-Alexandrium_andersonii.AAC.1
MAALCLQVAVQADASCSAICSASCAGSLGAGRSIDGGPTEKRMRTCATYKRGRFRMWSWAAAQGQRQRANTASTCFQQLPAASN